MKIQSRHTLIYLCILGVLSLHSCKKSISTEEPGNPRTVLVYMGGDNNLSDETGDKIASLRKASVSKGRLLIFQDALNQSPRLLEIKSGEVLTLKTYGPESSASPEVFKLVLQDLQKLAPADSYGLILFSHASGWLPQRTLIKPYAVAQDGKDDLELLEFAAVIPDDFFDFMIFEACFMTGIEVVYELHNKTDFIVASPAEILSPGFTPIYPELIPLLFSPEADLKKFAETFFSYYNALSGDYQSATIAVIRTSPLQALATWVKENKDRTVPAEDYKDIQKFDRYSDYTLFFDFEDYFQRASKPEASTQLHKLINDVVVYKAATSSFMKNSSGFDIIRYSGLSTYIPQTGFPYLNQEYGKLKWSRAAL
jgi:hypothetical protein